MASVPQFRSRGAQGLQGRWTSLANGISILSAGWGLIMDRMEQWFVVAALTGFLVLLASTAMVVLW